MSSFEAQALTTEYQSQLFQQRLNNAYVRLARMSGTLEPSIEELRENVVKRLASLPHEIRKRYNVQGTDFIPVNTSFDEGTLNLHAEGTQDSIE
jgi:hypothetical protein